VTTLSADPIFFPSANRLLASSPSGDFGLYGAQPVYPVSFAPSPAPGNDQDGPSQPSVPSAALPAGLIPLATDDAQGVPTSANPPLATGTIVPPQSLLPEQHPFQGGDAAVSPSATPLNPFDLSPVMLGSSQAAPHDGAPAHAAEAPLAGTPLGHPVLPADGTAPLDTIASTVAPVLGAIQDTSDAVLDTVDATIGALASPLFGALGDALPETIVDTVAPLTNGVTEAIAGLDVPHLIEAVPGIVAIGGVDDGSIDSAIDLLGSDPAGGIATLVNLVTVTDLLDLRDAGAPVDPTGEGLGTVSDLIDTLAADVPVAHDIDASDHHGEGQPATDTPLLPAVASGLPDPLTDHHDGALGLGLGGL
jgi:hypothetical protein